MQFSRNWLKEFVDLNISDEELCDQLTMLGLEVDNYKNYHSKLTGKDAVIKLDLTPNRGDCYSLLGVAREIAALNNLTVKLPKIKKVNSSVKSPIKVTVCDEAPSYVGRYLTGINLKNYHLNLALLMEPQQSYPLYTLQLHHLPLELKLPAS